MLWMGSIGGAIVGGALWGWTGAVVLGFLGWLAALIIRSRNEKPSPQPMALVPPRDSTEARLQRLEGALDELRQRLARLERGGVETIPEPAPVVAAPIVDEAIVAAPSAIPEPAAPPQPVMAPSEPPPIPEPPPAPEPEVTPVAPQAVPTPARPTLVERLLEGNIVAKLGVVILFFGVAFLLKFAYDRGLFPPGMRLLAVAAASAAMFFIGARLMASQRAYALVLMGGAMGLAYLDVFFALKTFGYIGPAGAFGLFAALGVATLYLAVRLDARAFAALGLLGGFMAPVLASTGSGQHVILFSYYLLLNGVILAVSWFRSWRELNFIGFLFTFAIALLWGHENYRPEIFATVEPFLIAFFALYLAIPILFAHRQPPQLRGVVDGTLIFGMPLAAAMMQAALVRGMGDHALAWSAAIAALVYGVLARTLWNRPNMRLLAESHLALAVVFGTVAPYFAFEGYPTFAFWTLEGAAIYWIGCRQRRILARAFALLLQVGAAGYFWWVTRDVMPAHTVWNERVIGCALISASAFATAWFMHRHAEAISEPERGLEGWALAWAGLWSLVAVHLAADLAWTDRHDRLAALLAWGALLLVATELIGSRLGWTRLRMMSVGGVPLMLLVGVVWAVGRYAHPLEGAGAWAWPLILSAQFFVVHRQRRDGLEGERAVRYDAAWAVLVMLATWEALWRHAQHQFEWVVAIGAVGVVAAGLRFHLRERGVEPGKRRSTWVLIWALAWWFVGFLALIGEDLPRAHHPAADLALAAGSVLLFELAGRAIRWPALRAAQFILPAGMLLAALAVYGRNANPFAQYQLWAWLGAFAVAWFTLRRQERDGVARQPSGQHVALFAAIVVLLAWEALWRVDRAGLTNAWRFGASGIVLAAGLAAAIEGLRRGWPPFADHREAFRGGAVVPMLVLALAWTVLANFGSDGAAQPMRYVPVLNTLDLAQLALFAAAAMALRRPGIGPEPALRWMQVFGAAGFLWLNAALLRTVHHWADVPWRLDALLGSVVAQASLSLLWTATALVAMFGARRQGSRPLWMAGAALLGIVVVKLFVNDLNNTGTVARIVSFIGVGVFMLLIGFLSPVPPRRAAAGEPPPPAADRLEA